MGKVNWTRVILGGLLAGVVIDIAEGIMSGLVLDEQWTAAIEALGKSAAMSGGAIAVVNILGFVIGIFVVWLYAAIRPRYGAGPKTAAGAGAAVWLIAYLIPSVFPVIMDFFPAALMVISLSVGLVEIVAATLLGAWIYKE
jgi:hypothetical protein